MKLFNKWFIKRKSKTTNKITDSNSLPTVPKDDASNSKDDYHKAIGKMSAFFAHEIRNPLTSIVGFTQVLEKDEAIMSNPNLQHYISIIKDESNKIESLIQELLNLANSHTYFENLSIIDVKSSIDKIINLFEYQLEDKQIQFKIEASSDSIFITGNENGFERSMINIIKNAIDSIKQDGEVYIKAFTENGTVIIDIIDTGPGIPEESLENIFYPFYTTKEDGTGIGLPICKTIIETMNGRIDIRNHEKFGVHVALKIPESKHASYKR